MRYGATLLFGRSDAGAFPWHTLGVNAAGALLLGLLMAVLPDGDGAEAWRLFLGVGVLGGFTTFSTFSYETLSLAQHGAWASAVGYVLASVVLALSCVAAGYAIGRAL